MCSASITLQRLTSVFADYLNVDDPYRAAFDISHLIDENGVIQKPDYADRVRIRLALSAPDDPLDKPSDPDSTDPDEQDWVITKPCIPPYAAGQSQRASSHHSSHHLLPMRGGPYGESDTPDVFIMPDEHIRNVGPSRKNSLCHPSCHASPLRGGPYGERYEYGVNSGANDEHMRNTAPSRKISSCRSSHVPPTQGGPYGAGYQYDEYIASVNDSRARGEPLHRSGTGHGYYQSVRRTNGDPVTYAYA